MHYKRHDSMSWQRFDTPGRFRQTGCITQLSHILNHMLCCCSRVLNTERVKRGEDAKWLESSSVCDGERGTHRQDKQRRADWGILRILQIRGNINSLNFVFSCHSLFSSFLLQHLTPYVAFQSIQQVPLISSPQCSRTEFKLWMCVMSE